MPASFGCLPRRISSTINIDARLNRFASPRPVDPAAPASPSTYNPAPRIGESPTRPGILNDRPLVDVTPQTSPTALTPLQWIVPYMCSDSENGSALSPLPGGRRVGFGKLAASVLR